MRGDRAYYDEPLNSLKCWADECFMTESQDYRILMLNYRLFFKNNYLIVIISSE